MGKTYIPLSDRRLVQGRAENRCEYCLIHEDDTAFGSEDAEFGCHFDHIIAEKHGGRTEPENLAYACAVCNRNKGSDIASLSAEGVITRFFNPRTDGWAEHFRIEGDRLLASTPIAEATERIFNFNSRNRRLERRNLQLLGRYPTTISETSPAD